MQHNWVSTIYALFSIPVQSSNVPGTLNVNVEKSYTRIEMTPSPRFFGPAVMLSDSRKLVFYSGNPLSLLHQPENDLKTRTSNTIMETVWIFYFHKIVTAAHRPAENGVKLFHLWNENVVASDLLGCFLPVLKEPYALKPVRKNRSYFNWDGMLNIWRVHPECVNFMSPGKLKRRRARI